MSYSLVRDTQLQNETRLYSIRVHLSLKQLRSPSITSTTSSENVYTFSHSVWTRGYPQAANLPSFPHLRGSRDLVRLRRLTDRTRRGCLYPTELVSLEYVVKWFLHLHTRRVEQFRASSLINRVCLATTYLSVIDAHTLYSVFKDDVWRIRLG